jgi:hypothetical protein
MMRMHFPAGAIASLLVSPLFFATGLAAQVRIDLAGQSSGTTETRPAEPGRILITIVNRLPQARYDVTVRRETIPIAPFSIEGLGSLKALVPSTKEAAIAVSSPCAPLLMVMQTLNAADREAQVPDRARAVAEELAGKTCADPATLDDAQRLLASTSNTLREIPLARGERLVVSVERGSMPPGGASAVWTVVVDAGPRGEWVATYGVAFVSNKDQTFFTKSAAGGKFRITPERDEKSLSVIPSVFYHWLSAARKNRNLAFSPTAGIGPSSTSPAFFIGGSILYNWNLALAAGVGVYQQRRLHGRYADGDETAESLSEDQLHRKVFRPGFMAALTFRFGSNPFETNDSSGSGSTGPAAPPAAPATASTGGGASPEAAVRDPDFKLAFDSQGALKDASRSELTGLLDRAAQATDIFILSHGWWNDADSADCFYRRMIGGLRRQQPGDLTEDRFRPVFVSVYWPSAVFPLQPGDCPAAEANRTEVAVAGSLPPTRIREWAVNAFPEAAARPDFEGDLARVTALNLKENAGQALTEAEATDFASILLKWRQFSRTAELPVSDGPEPELFRGSAGEIVKAWNSRPVPREEFGVLGGGEKKWLNFGNAFTFWTMKERAGIVGSRGLYEVLKALQPFRANAHIHLIGHSFGGKLLAAALTGHRPTGGNRADSLVILQGAFSQFAFSTRDAIMKAGVESDRPGLYLDVVASRLVAGPIVATFSGRDLPNRMLYPAGVALVGDVVEAAREPRYGSLGARGIRAAAATALDLSQQRLRDAMTSEGTVLVTVDGSVVILGHSDLVKPAVFNLIWDAVDLGSAVPR